MVEDWANIPEFDRYLISDHGRVKNEDTDRLLSLTLNTHGILQAGMMKNCVQHRRSVTLLVANAFLDPPKPATFNTPINLDGDRTNNHFSNLMWRPKHFSRLYHAQFKVRCHNAIDRPIVDLSTGQEYPTALHACVQFGLLEREIVNAIASRTYVWPTYQQFAIL